MAFNQALSADKEQGTSKKHESHLSLLTQALLRFILAAHQALICLTRLRIPLFLARQHFIQQLACGIGQHLTCSAIAFYHRGHKCFRLFEGNVRW